MNEESLKTLQKTFAPVLMALREHRGALAKIAGLAAARPGYRLLPGDVKEPALVLAFHPPRPALDLDALAARFGVKVRAATASPEEQILGASSPSFASPLRRLLEPLDAPDFAPRRGNYTPPSGAGAPQLDPVDEEMEVTVCASPDAGWPVLRDFFGEGIAERLTVAMYDFTALHVRDALLAALDGSTATLRLVLDGKTASGGVGGNGINGPDRREAEVMQDLREALGDRLELARASVGAAGAVPTAYHIKVAVADGERLWLSSGNWQSSNLAPFDFRVPGDKPPLPLGRYNRDYHVTVRNAALAGCYAGFIEHDATLGRDFAVPEADTGPMLLVPDEVGEPAAFAPIRRFEPLTVSGRVKVTPLLTPDNFPGFVNKLLANAKKRVWIQNQYLKPDQLGDNFPELERLLELLGALAKTVDLRLCLRTPDEASRDRILAAGVAASQIRRQSNCHAKLIVVDDEHVVIGSQNFSNDGFVANRDASLAFEHRELTEYFATIFETDWDRASPIADGDSFALRVATGEDTPAGHTRVPWAAVFDTAPPVLTGSIRGGVATPAVELPRTPGALDDLPFFGVDEAGHRAFGSSSNVAAALRAGHRGADPAQEQLGKMVATPFFGLAPGASAEVLGDVGWGVVWAPSISQAVKDALRPLLDHRRAEVADDAFFHELDYVPGESARQFLQRRAVDFGSVRGNAVPYYLLLVGSPAEIPFSFQTLLDVEYRVGRLDLATAAAYGDYAKGVVAVEEGKVAARERVLHSFGPGHPGDTATRLSVEVLTRAAESWLGAFQALKKEHRLSSRMDAGDDATKARLLEVLRGGAAGRPEVLFTAGHGMVFRAGSLRQAGEQGALVTADWDGLSAIDAAAMVTAADVPGDADVGGLVAFLFACFGAGTPATDSFPTRAGQALAPQEFVSALPQALLSHPQGAALGVFGHIDRTLTWSLQPPGAPVATDPFATAVLRVLAGNRLGAALEDLNQRGATLAAIVAEALRPGAPPIDDAALVRTWTQQRDATAFVLLGDPAARLRR